MAEVVTLDAAVVAVTALLQVIEERARSMHQGGSDNIRAAAIAARYGIPATFLVRPVEPERDPRLPPDVYVLTRPTSQGRRYRVYLWADEIPEYRRACRMVSATVRALQYHISRVYTLQGAKVTWKDVQAARLLVRGLGWLVTDYDVARLVKLAELLKPEVA
ncbi:MAG: hypothetical protein QW085_05645 [Pyrobaculum sp.]